MGGAPVHDTLNLCITQDKLKLREESQAFETARFSAEFVFSGSLEQAGSSAQLLSSLASFGCAVIRSLGFAVICCNRWRTEDRDYPVGAAFSRDSNILYDLTM